jgi:hypothetical protein
MSDDGEEGIKAGAPGPVWDGARDGAWLGARDGVWVQLAREYRESMAAERVERERRDVVFWDFEGWHNGRLQVYITGMGLMRLTEDQVRQLGGALLAEHELYTTEAEETTPTGTSTPGTPT